MPNANCLQCSEPLTGRFCARCGAPAQPASELPENLVCALTYAIGALTGVLFLMLEPYNKNSRVRFHAMQSLFVNGAVVFVWFALLAITAAVSLIPFVGGIVSALVLGVFGLGVVALWVALLVKAHQGEYWKVPILGDLAEAQANARRG